MVAEWVDAAKVFADLGFFAVTAWLLAERFYMSRQRDKMFTAIMATINTNSEAMRIHAIATQRLADMVEREATLMAEFRHQIVDIRREKR